MTRVARQVNRQRYLFVQVLPLPCLVMNGTPKSTEVWLNARNDIRARSSGSGAIICLVGVAFLLQHDIHALLLKLSNSGLKVLITLDLFPDDGPVHVHA